MHESKISRDAAWELLRKYNKEPFHLQHALTLEGVMRWFADFRGYGDEADYWGIVGLLHDIDFEMYPEQHCQKAPELLKAAGVGDDMIHAICSEVAPEHEMEKILFAVDEFTGLIGAVALMHPSKSVKDMKVSSVKKKFKDKHFAAGCSRAIISQGVANLKWEIGDFTSKTIKAMQSCEDEIRTTMEKLA